ncbi:hypothetical protein EJB05_20154, partial [Eragrostis curvula]
MSSTPKRQNSDRPIGSPFLLTHRHLLKAPTTPAREVRSAKVEEEEEKTSDEREQKRARRSRSQAHHQQRIDAMACINMYNPDGAAGFGGGPQPPVAALGPRISFSSDFAVEPPPPVQNRAMSLRCQEEDINFEFSVGSHPMMAADQLFSKGRILPLKDGGVGFAARPPTTLRDELRGDDDDERGSAAKASSRWKEMLGLRKALCVGGLGAAKKSDKGSSCIADADMVTDTAASYDEMADGRRDMGLKKSHIVRHMKLLSSLLMARSVKQEACASDGAFSGLWGSTVLSFVSLLRCMNI